MAPPPFPGMDPWLEHPALWPDVHGELIFQIRRQLQARVGERYYVAAGERVYLETPQTRQLTPDAVVVEEPAGPPPGATPAPGAADRPTVVALEPVEAREHFLEVRDLRHDHRVVTVIELLSPANKRRGAGREQYLRKQAEVLASEAHLVEVDLLRGGMPTVALPEEWEARSRYRVVVSRAGRRSEREFHAFGVRDRLPRVAIPLRDPDPDVVLDLPAAFAEAYEAGAYARRAGHDQEPVPPLSLDDASWARKQLRPS